MRRLVAALVPMLARSLRVAAGWTADNRWISPRPLNLAHQGGEDAEYVQNAQALGRLLRGTRRRDPIVISFRHWRSTASTSSCRASIWRPACARTAS